MIESARSQLAARAAELAGVSLVLVDPAGKLTYVNPAAETLFQQSRKRLLALRLDRLGAVGRMSWSLAERAIAEDRTLVAHDVELATALGPRAVSFDAGPDGEGAALAIRLAPQRSDANGAPSAAEAARGFGRLLSHELKNPLAGARGAAQLIGEGGDLETNEFAALIISEIDRARGIAERWSRIGDVAPQAFSAVNINAIVDRAVSSARAAWPGIWIEEHFDPSLPEAWGDDELLVQALSNLITNACEACRDHQNPCVSLRTRYRQPSPGGPAPHARLEVEIRDNGPGVSSALRASLFNPFVTSKPAGEGLGLALVSRILELHDGAVELAAEPGASDGNEDQLSGAVFRLFLPMEAMQR
ncbi:MAG: ATP-binding protein [Pseudomonadota bacterium]